MVFLFKTSTSESLSELRKVRVKRQKGERNARAHKSYLLEFLALVINPARHCCQVNSVEFGQFSSVVF